MENYCKVIAINGSPNKEGNTFHALSMVGTELKAAGIEFEILQIGHKMIHGCIACGKCAINKDERCSITSDELNDWIQHIKQDCCSKIINRMVRRKRQASGASKRGKDVR